MAKKTLNEGIGADDGGVGYAVRGGEVMAFTLPGKIGGA